MGVEGAFLSRELSLASGPPHATAPAVRELPSSELSPGLYGLDMALPSRVPRVPPNTASAETQTGAGGGRFSPWAHRLSSPLPGAVSSVRPGIPFRAF